MVFSGNQCLYWYFGVQELHLVKNLTPSQASPVRKIVRARFVECKSMCEGLFIDYRALWFTELAKYKNDEDCRCSRSAPETYHWCWPNEMILVLSFLSVEKVQSISAPVFQMPPYVGFVTTLGLRLRFAFAPLSCLSMLSFHFGRIADSRLLSFVLVLASLLIHLQWGYIWSPLLFWHYGA
jgi:hypothetical protein